MGSCSKLSLALTSKLVLATSKLDVILDRVKSPWALRLCSPVATATRLTLMGILASLLITGLGINIIYF